MKKLIVVSLLALAGLTGCNTMYGFGQDLSNAGNAISGAAQ